MLPRRLLPGCTAQFAGNPAEARLADLEPGRHLALVQSNKGYVCSRELDFLEFTRRVDV
jgi:hypothetical protein